MKPEGGKHVGKAEALAEINKYHLMFAGYSAADIIGFGDLGKLAKERMGGLIRRKAVKEAGKSFDEAGVETKLLHQPDEKEK